MKAYDFVKEMIDQIVNDYTFVQCRYQKEDFDNSHFVEIVPASYLEDCDDLTLTRNKFIMDFIKTYPGQTLTFISDDDLVEIDDSIYTNSGKGFEMLKFVTTSKSHNQESVNLNVFEELFVYNTEATSLSLAA